MSEPSRVRPRFSPPGDCLAIWKRFQSDGDIGKLRRALAVEDWAHLDDIRCLSVRGLPELSSEELNVLRGDPERWNRYKTAAESRSASESRNAQSVERLEQLAVYLRTVQRCDADRQRVLELASTFGSGVVAAWDERAKAHTSGTCDSRCAWCFWEEGASDERPPSQTVWTPKDDVPF